MGGGGNSVHFSIIDNAICNTGVSVFILISGFYGIKFRYDKVIDLMMITTFYSVLFYIVGHRRDILHITYFQDINALSEAVKSLFPIFCNKYWFATSYIILVFMAKPIEILFNTVSKKEIKSFLIVMTIFLYILPTLFVFEIFNDSGKGFMNMALVYSIGRYFKLYGFPNVLNRYHIFIFAFLLSSIIVLSEILYFCGIENYKVFMRDCSFLILSLSIVIFYWFTPFRVKPCSNIFINGIAKMVFPVYIIHFVLISNICKVINGLTNIFILDFMLSIFVCFLLSILVETGRKYIFGRIFDNYISLISTFFVNKIPYL